ncbi:hypothetical protein AAMO2058_001371700 [Amorphochlora amoebiformis]
MGMRGRCFLLICLSVVVGRVCQGQRSRITPQRAAAGFHRRPISVAGPSFFRRAPRRTLSVRNWLANLFGGEGGGEAPLPSFEEGTFDYVDIPVSDSILAGTPLQGRELARCYQASKHGWDAKAFHNRCDNKGPSLVVGRTTSGVTFGGFMPLEWKSSNDYRETDRDFLFYVPNKNADPVKISKRDFSPVYDYRRGGPQWGSEGLLIGEPESSVMGVFTGPDPEGVAIGNLQKAKSKLGLSHERGPDGRDSLFGSDNKVILSELEVYCSPEIAAMYL